MKQIGIQKAEARLAKARDALERVRSSPNFQAFETAWSDFLISLNAVPVILEKAARDNPQSRQWFGGKKNQCRRDELLRYLHQARNADEHGLEPVAEHDPGGIGYGAGGQGILINGVSGPGGFQGTIRTIGGEPLRVAVTPPHPKLATVRDDRFGDAFDPPKEHGGAPLPYNDPLFVAEMGFIYYEQLIAEAKKMVPKPPASR